MKIFLSARYGRRLEMVQRALELEGEGHEVVSSWLKTVVNASTQSVEDAEHSMPYFEAQLFAVQDLSDLKRAEVYIAFTERVDSPHGRGGRHVEYGVALERQERGDLKYIFIIGPRENIFYCLTRTTDKPIIYYSAWDLKTVTDTLWALEGSSSKKTYPLRCPN